MIKQKEQFEIKMQDSLLEKDKVLHDMQLSHEQKINQVKREHAELVEKLRVDHELALNH